jgi:hypothetical protein
MRETRFVVARNDWIARQLIKKIYKGRLADYGRVLMKTQKEACHQIQKMPFGRQELYSVFRIEFDPDKIIRS